MNTEDMIEREGISFLHLMREMMKCEPEAQQSREIQSGNSAPLIEEEKALKDENYEPKKVIKKRTENNREIFGNTLTTKDRRNKKKKGRKIRYL